MICSGQANAPKPGTPEADAIVEAWVQQSRTHLLKLHPDQSKIIERMSDAEVGVRYWWFRVQQLRDRLSPAAQLEYHLAIPYLIEASRLVLEDLADELLVQLAIEMYVRTEPVHSMGGCEQTLGMLRVVEAIRDTVSRHPGKLPRNLNEVVLPIPDDCLSGLPFEYEVAPGLQSAELRGKSFPLPDNEILKVWLAAKHFGRVYKLELDAKPNAR